MTIGDNYRLWYTSLHHMYLNGALIYNMSGIHIIVKEIGDYHVSIRAIRMNRSSALQLDNS